MKSRRNWVVAAMIAALVNLVLGAGCEPPQAPEEEGAQQERAIPVRVAQAESMRLSQLETYSATIQAWEQAQILGQSGQRIEQIYVDEGDRVRKGQAIARMDESNLRQAEVELRTAETELERARRLVGIGAMASQQLEQAEARFETAQTNAQMLRENTHLVSPIAGVVTDKYFVAGEQFMAGAQAPGIVTVQQLHPLKVVIDVSERFYSVLQEGMEAAVRVDAYRGQEFEGEIWRKRQTVDPASRTFGVEIRVENEGGELSPGMSGEVRLAMGEVEGRFLPRSAMIFEPGRENPFVYVVEEGRARRVYVEAGVRVEQYQEVLGGLSDNAQVVVEGMGRLNEGSAVEIAGAEDGGEEESGADAEAEEIEEGDGDEPPQGGRAQEIEEGEEEAS